jgi:hypothetical protein
METLGTNHGTRVLPALGQHVHVELTFANLASIAADAILESLSMNVTGARKHGASSRGCRCRSSLNSLMLNGSWTHHRINSPVCNCTSSTKSHTLSNG